MTYPETTSKRPEKVTRVGAQNGLTRAVLAHFAVVNLLDCDI